MRKNTPLPVAGFLGVNRDDDALAAELLRAFADQLRLGQGGAVNTNLVRTRLEHDAHVLHRANPAADRQRHEAAVGHPLHHIDHRAAPVRAGGDVEENHLVGALLIIANGQLDRVADVAQPPLLRTAKLHPARNDTVVHVQTGNHSLG